MKREAYFVKWGNKGFLDADLRREGISFEVFGLTGIAVFGVL